MYFDSFKFVIYVKKGKRDSLTLGLPFNPRCKIFSTAAAYIIACCVGL